MCWYYEELKWDEFSCINDPASLESELEAIQLEITKHIATCPECQKGNDE